MDNIAKCDVCGGINKITLHHIVPFMYLRCMSSESKAAISFKIKVMLCEPCHVEYEKLAMGFKKYLALKYDEPLDDTYLQPHLLPQIYVRALLRRFNHGSTIPLVREQEMKAVVDKFANKDTTPEDWQEIALRPVDSFYPEGFETHAIRLLKKIPNVDEFVNIWVLHYNKFKAQRQSTMSQVSLQKSSHQQKRKRKRGHRGRRRGSGCNKENAIGVQSFPIDALMKAVNSPQQNIPAV